MRGTGKAHSGGAVMLAAALLAVTPAANADDSNQARAVSKLRHVIIIMQENRSFDHYFGT
jgi:phospholipase C